MYGQSPGAGAIIRVAGTGCAPVVCQGLHVSPTASADALRALLGSPVSV